MKLKKIRPARLLGSVAMTLVCVLWATPLIYGVLTSFKAETEIKRMDFHLIPEVWTLENYTEVLGNTGNTPVVRWFFNSLVISGITCVAALFIISFAAYGYTRISWRGRDAVFYTVLALSFFPQIVNIIPLYYIMATLDWVNTILAVIFPALGTVTNIFLVRQFMLGIPRDYDEAARIDGAGEFKIYWRIILPMIKPILTVVALFTFTASWNDLLWPSIVFSEIPKLPLTPGLQLLMGSYGNFFLGAIMAGAVLALIPTLILYIFAQKYFLQSLSLSAGVKG